jgi:DNA-binding winged helix-turn-helix (wHTH) protein
MDRKVLQFDRFTLDLTRGCLRQADQDIPLRPKTFEVLRHLAQNSGQLVSKQELLETVWPRVVVSDDSLMQCIRELRQKLGRDGHRLIKTVPRRGYLLDAAPAPAGLGSALAKSASGSFELSRVAAGSLKVWAGILKGLKAQPRRLWGAVAGVVCLALSIGYLLLPNGAVASSELFTKVDKERLATVAASKRLPLPSFGIAKPDETVPTEARSFVGVWVSEKGWVGSNRQMLLIVTSAANGMVAGYVVHGPAQPKSPIQSPAHFRTFKANRTGASFSYSDPSGVYTASLISDDRIEFRVEYRDGHVGFVDLYPFWTLAAAERRAQASLRLR